MNDSCRPPVADSALGTLVGVRPRYFIACLRSSLLAAVMLSLLAFPTRPASAAELIRLTVENWDDVAPQGKEVDAIEGDWVLRNSHLVAVVAQPLRTRNANMTVRDVGGGVIDLTRRDRPNDQLSAFYPGGGQLKFHGGKVEIIVDGQPLEGGAEGPIRGEQLELRIEASTAPCEASVSYRLSDGQPFLEVVNHYTNGGQETVQPPAFDSVRADRTFAFGVDEPVSLFWAHDEWFRQAYGIQAPGAKVSREGDRGVVVRYRNRPSPVEPGKTESLTRRLLVDDHLIGVRGRAASLAGQETAPWKFRAVDPAGPVVHGKVELLSGEEVWASGRTDDKGQLSAELPHGSWTVRTTGQGRPVHTMPLDLKGPSDSLAQLQATGYVEAKVTVTGGQSTPCKVAFHGIDGTENPNFGPDSAAGGVLNAQYTADGTFRCEIAPGRYEALISRGPEHDLVTREIQVRRGETTRLEAELTRTVQTPGWVSADFHSHSSPSGDNTGSQLGRVLNLLAEQVEFAPCTEHNRISSYVPHLRSLQASQWMSTCSGMELTGSPLVINHQNAFPLIHKPHQQDGGAPVTDSNPVAQIERLALWDDASEKLVQTNHPQLPQIIGDKDLDGKYDGGFERMLGFMDVIEVHPASGIFTPPPADAAGRKERNPIFHWMQMLNLGYRIPGVVNTDGHYNFHESGFRRNYLPSSTDDPGKIDTMEMVRAAERGAVVMTTGPYLEVSMSSGDRVRAIPGQDLSAVQTKGQVTLKVRVQCANWLDVNRVQVFVNGRPVPELNFTRRTHGEEFSDGVVKFEKTLKLELEGDSHVIVAAAGEGLKLGRVMGPRFGELMPIAVANPIFVDVDGKGFQPNGDLLDRPLPHGELQVKHDHDHDHDADHQHADGKHDGGKAAAGRAADNQEGR